MAGGDGRRGSDRAHPTNPRDRYTSAHWGIGPKVVHRFEVGQDVEPSMPRAFTEMGKLQELHVEVQDGPHAGSTLEIKLPQRPSSVLAFSTDDAERLYIFTPPSTNEWCRETLLVGKFPFRHLGTVARDAGGRQAGFPYPGVQVQTLGRLVAVIYKTAKKGDGMSSYIHHMGEESGVQPYLTIDTKGRLWVAGGNYTVPDEGITD